MKTGTKKALDKLRLGMSPRQHVFAMIEDARRAGSITEAARTFAREFGKEPSVLDRIAQAVVQEMKGHPAVEANRAARRAQREALYLCKLFRNCNFEVITNEREWTLGALVAYLGLRAPENDGEIFEASVRFAWNHWFELETHRLAVVAIQDVEFGGADVLLPYERSVLSRHLADAERVVDLIKRVAGHELWARPELPDVQAAAGKLALTWRTLARCEVHGAFGEDWSGVRLASELLGGEGGPVGVHSAAE